MLKVILISFLFLGYGFSQNIPIYNVTLEDPEASAGYYFLHSFKIGVQPSGFHTMMLDRYGNLVYYKKFNSPANDFKLQVNGKMSYAFTPAGNPNAGNFHIMDSTFFIKDTIRCVNGIFTDTHDMIILPNGHYLLMGFEFRVMNLSSYNWFNGNGSPGSPNATVKCGVIQVLDANKNLVFMWKCADYFQFSDVDERWLFNPNNVDWTHFNSAELDSDGNILISVRHFNEVTKVNRQTGAIMWRMGGKRNQFTFINDPHSGFFGQHDARRISGGNITVFDNAYIQQSMYGARAVEYAVNEQALTSQLVWSSEYSPNSSSRFLGNAQRLANSNIVIGWGGLLNANVTFTCIKPGGGKVMEISFPDTQYTYRAFNFPLLPFRLNRPVVSCYASSGNFYLDAGEGHASYLWSTGSTARTIQISAADTYYVYVPYGQGGYISSERIIITNINNPCQSIGINQTNAKIPGEFALHQNYPNPFNPGTKIKFEIPKNGFTNLRIYDARGREIKTLISKNLSYGIYEVDWDASDYPSGVYFYILKAENYKETRKMVLIK